ncbi:hypothetical protein PAALTS15_11649 [Paenibacillus alvei TS-15]|uniref:Uncharacterized protein n=1 Tax=Paenibacillus alvei TS-15 TaxID=1117108 RepID=S9SR20_PAEAL|nr:hypothetical protein PAALTS15_11649 [Paenibacillus alvei TS-15]
MKKKKRKKKKKKRQKIRKIKTNKYMKIVIGTAFLSSLKEVVLCFLNNPNHALIARMRVQLKKTSGQ